MCRYGSSLYEQVRVTLCADAGHSVRMYGERCEKGPRSAVGDLGRGSRAAGGAGRSVEGGADREGEMPGEMGW